jgi:uncharacterized membrane protein
LTIVALWLLFAATHIAFSSLTLRPRLVGVLGNVGFQAAYSLIALATFVPMVTIYFQNKHAGAMFWSIGATPPVEALVTVVMTLALVILVAGFFAPNPSMMGPKEKGPILVTGVNYVTRHSMFMAVGLFGLVHLIPNGFASDIAFFAGFPIFAVIGCMHQDARKLVTDEKGYTDFHAATPLIPFTGKNTLQGLREIPPLGYALGIGIAAALRFFHPQLFG